MRSAGDTIELPDYSVNNAGDYNVGVLTAAANEVYLDLSEAVKFNLTPDPKAFVAYVAKSNTTTGELYAKFTVKTDGIFIPFADDVKAKLQQAVKDGYTFNVVINGSTSAAASATNANVRWCFGQDTGSNWNISNMIQSSNFANALSGKLDTFTVVGNMKGLVIQAGGGNVADIAPYTARINSIKVTINPPTKAVSSISFTLGQPVAGLPAPASVSGTGWTGAVTWSPIPPNGKFAVSTTYYASVALSPTADYYILPNVAVSINGVSAAYDVVGKTVSKTGYSATDAVIRPLPTGVLWDVDTSGWLTDSAGQTSLYGRDDPVTGNAQGPAVAITISDTGANKGITLTSAADQIDNYSCAIDIKLVGIDDRLDPAFYKIKVVVTGKVLRVASHATASKGKMKIGGKDNPWSEIAKSADDLGVDDTFTLTVAAIPADFNILPTQGNGGTIRIQSDAPSSNKAYINSYIITGITISNEGER